MQKLVMYRLIADEGKVLTNGTVEAQVIDVAPNGDVGEWKEIDKKEETK